MGLVSGKTDPQGSASLNRILPLDAVSENTPDLLSGDQWEFFAQTGSSQDNLQKPTPEFSLLGVSPIVATNEEVFTLSPNSGDDQASPNPAKPAYISDVLATNPDTDPDAANLAGSEVDLSF